MQCRKCSNNTFNKSWYCHEHLFEMRRLKTFGEIMYAQEAILEHTQNGVTRCWKVHEISATSITFRCYENDNFVRDIRVAWEQLLNDGVLKPLDQILD